MDGHLTVHGEHEHVQMHALGSSGSGSVASGLVCPKMWVEQSYPGLEDKATEWHLAWALWPFPADQGGKAASSPLPVGASCVHPLCPRPAPAWEAVASLYRQPFYSIQGFVGGATQWARETNGQRKHHGSPVSLPRAALCGGRQPAPCQSCPLTKTAPQLSHAKVSVGFHMCVWKIMQPAGRRKPPQLASLAGLSVSAVGSEYERMQMPALFRWIFFVRVEIGHVLSKTL